MKLAEQVEQRRGQILNEAERQLDEGETGFGACEGVYSELAGRLADMLTLNEQRPLERQATPAEVWRTFQHESREALDYKLREVAETKLALERLERDFRDVFLGNSVEDEHKLCRAFSALVDSLVCQMGPAGPDEQMRQINEGRDYDPKLFAKVRQRLDSWSDDERQDLLTHVVAQTVQSCR